MHSPLCTKAIHGLLILLLLLFCGVSKGVEELEGQPLPFNCFIIVVSTPPLCVFGAYFKGVTLNSFTFSFSSNIFKAAVIISCNSILTSLYYK